MKYIYKIESGALNNFTNQYYLSDSFFSSLAKANKEIEQILKINQAVITHDAYENAKKAFVPYGGLGLRNIDYIGEGGNYKARIILTKVRLN